MNFYVWIWIFLVMGCLKKNTKSQLNSPSQSVPIAKESSCNLNLLQIPEVASFALAAPETLGVEIAQPEQMGVGCGSVVQPQLSPKGLTTGIAWRVCSLDRKTCFPKEMSADTFMLDGVLYYPSIPGKDMVSTHEEFGNVPIVFLARGCDKGFAVCGTETASAPYTMPAFSFCKEKSSEETRYGVSKRQFYVLADNLVQSSCQYVDLLGEPKSLEEGKIFQTAKNICHLGPDLAVNILLEEYDSLLASESQTLALTDTSSCPSSVLEPDPVLWDSSSSSVGTGTLSSNSSSSDGGITSSQSTAEFPDMTSVDGLNSSTSSSVTSGQTGSDSKKKAAGTALMVVGLVGATIVSGLAVKNHKEAVLNYGQKLRNGAVNLKQSLQRKTTSSAPATNVSTSNATLPKKYVYSALGLLGVAVMGVITYLSLAQEEDPTAKYLKTLDGLWASLQQLMKDLKSEESIIFESKN